MYILLNGEIIMGIKFKDILSDNNKKIIFEDRKLVDRVYLALYKNVEEFKQLGLDAQGKLSIQIAKMIEKR